MMRINLLKNFLSSLLCVSLICGLSVSASSDTITYTLRDHDTIATIAARYALPEEAIRYYNHIDTTTDVVDATITTVSRTTLSKLTLRPLWGSVIESQHNQTLTTIAKQYALDVRELLLFNPQDAKTPLEEGIEIFLPYYDTRQTKTADIARISANGGTKVDLSTLSRKTGEEAIGKFMRFVYDDIDMGLGTILSTRYQRGLGAGGFVAGQCTDYAASRRPDLFPSRAKRLFGGDAKDRYANAKKAGVPVGKIPKKGAIAVFAPGRGGHKTYGHVAYVEKVSDDGKIEITDMNFKGINVVTRRIMSAHLPVGYIYN